MVCSHVIESPGRLMIVDAQLLLPYAREVRAYADGLGKPIDRVVVTHTHPDHWMGLDAFSDLAIEALPETAAELSKIGGYLLDFKRKTHGDRVADRLVLPNRELAEGVSSFDGITLRCTRLVDAEAPLMALLSLPDQRVLVAQDLVYNRVYLVAGDKNAAGGYLFDGWIRALREAQKDGYDLVLSGHGEPASPDAFGECAGFVTFVKDRFLAGTGEGELRKEIVGRFPGYRVPEMLDLMSLFLYHRTW